MTEPIVRASLRVRYNECDPQQIVFNGHYLTYADIAFTEAARTLFGGWATVVQRGADVVVAEANVRYLGSAGFDDVLGIDVCTQHLGTTSMVLRFDMFLRDDLINQVTTRYVWVDARTLKPTPPPVDIREAFARHLLERP